MSHKEINDALQYVAENEVNEAMSPIDTPIWELVCRKLYTIANSPSPKVRGSMGRASSAQKMILDRRVGRRRPGTHPAQTGAETLEFVDLTVAVIEAGEAERENEAAEAAAREEEMGE